jgi:hypothetical protein
MRIALIVAIAIIAFVQGAHATPDFWRAEGWKTDFSQTRINLKETMSGRCHLCGARAGHHIHDRR